MFHLSKSSVGMAVGVDVGGIGVAVGMAVGTCVGSEILSGVGVASLLGTAVGGTLVGVASGAGVPSRHGETTSPNISFIASRRRGPFSDMATILSVLASISCGP